MKPKTTKTGKIWRRLSLTFVTVCIAMLVVTYLFCRDIMKAEVHMRYVGIMNVASQKIAKTVSGMEMNAMNVFDEVGKHMENPDAVIAALGSKTSLNPDIRGYFAAFEPDYFPQMGRWFEPYVHQPDSTGTFEVRQVGSARHDYTRSDWYVRAKKSNDSFWSDPYYYYDGTSISGHYCTFVKPVYNAAGELICVCGADMTFEWLTKELERINSDSRNDELLNRYPMLCNNDFYTVIINNDGSCIAHPEGKNVPLKDDNVLHNLAQRKSGTTDMVINGEPATVYYAPIDRVSWSVAVIVPAHASQKPMLEIGGILIAIVVLGMIVVWFILRRIKHDETA